MDDTIKSGANLGLNLNKIISTCIYIIIRITKHPARIERPVKNLNLLRLPQHTVGVARSVKIL